MAVKNGAAAFKGSVICDCYGSKRTSPSMKMCSCDILTTGHIPKVERHLGKFADVTLVNWS